MTGHPAFLKFFQMSSLKPDNPIIATPQTTKLQDHEKELQPSKSIYSHRSQKNFDPPQSPTKFDCKALALATKDVITEGRELRKTLWSTRQPTSWNSILDTARRLHYALGSAGFGGFYSCLLYYPCKTLRLTLTIIVAPPNNPSSAVSNAYNAL